MNELLSMSGLAKKLGVAKSTIHTWTNDGVIIPAIQEGKVYRYDLDEVKTRLSERAKEKAEIKQHQQSP